MSDYPDRTTKEDAPDGHSWTVPDEMPDVIWASTDKGMVGTGRWVTQGTENPFNRAEYTRADLIPAMLAAAREEGALAMQEAAISTIAENETARCASCGMPRNDHPYRHPFQGTIPDFFEAIRAIDPKEVTK